MTPSPKIPNEKNLPGDNSSSTDEFSHPSFHLHHESVASTDESNSSDSDSDDQNPSTIDSSHGYYLLPQESNAAHIPRADPSQSNEQTPTEDNNDDEFYRFVRHRLDSTVDELRHYSSLNSAAHPIESVWSGESLLVDDKKADYIKAFMSAIKLPESSIPLWAQSCSEQEWHDKLRQRMIYQQTTFFFTPRT